ncbi:HlyD family efflux transporter periplasmic adaptor subunit [Polymorphobacter arshaanensis]|uniref:HlyD family efflux transporter periplasmic adaptor subunit n=1 Tax=Glacieibacterium arshaanense TaxID=2511025 RepID=A0A4Y9EQZ7_9SPHN|nr:efflux RND transporter periplasmic adaptor subunit [Polymorphobacter arshaanensis]TFU05862.1 HlyD family efflux transporter periplasmic adaptor subunit [Polymorphobacter arshaanensis]
MTDDTTVGTADADTPPATNRRRLVLLVFLIAVVIIGFGLWRATRPAPDQIQGMVEADEVNVAAKAIGRIASLTAKEGDMVAAGQVLAKLSVPEIAASERQTAAAVTGAKALESLVNTGARPEDIASVKAVWDAAQAVANLAATSSRRADTLFREGVISAQRRDEITAAQLSSAAQAEAARQQYLKLVAGLRQQDKVVAASQVAVAQATADLARTLGSEMQLTAPIGGEVARRLGEVGEVVFPGVPVFQIIDMTRLHVVLNLREDQFNAVKHGTELRGAVPALKLADARFRVEHIAPRGEFATWRATRQSSGYDIHSFEVQVVPMAPIVGLRPGMSVLFDWPQSAR